MDIRNPAQLNQILEKIVTEVIEEVSEKVLKRLQENIDRDTYGSHDPNKWYLSGSKRPSGQFKDSFEWEDTKKIANEITKTLWYNWQKMGNDPNEFFHGSNIKGWPSDARQFLADFLNKSGPSSSLFISVNHEPFWTNTLNEIFQNGELKQWFDSAFKRRGIQ